MGYVQPNYTWTKVSSVKVNNKGSYPGASIGGGIDYHFKTNYGIHASLRFTHYQFGLSEIDTFGILLENASYRMECIGLPIGLKMTTSPLQRYFLYAKLGFIPEYTVISKINAEFNTSPDLKKLNKFSVSYFIELGNETKLNNRDRLQIGLIISNGLTSVIDSKGSVLLNSIGLKGAYLF